MTTAALELLLEKYLSDEISKADFATLWSTVHQPEHKGFWLANLDRLLQNPLLHQLAESDAIDKAWNKVNSEVLRPAQNVIVHRVHFLRTAWFRYAAAVILILGLAAYIFISKQSDIEKPVVVQELNKEPGKDKAILTLSDGRKIVLNDSASENISDGSISIEKSNGVLTYNTVLTSAAEALAKASYNIMNTPRGGQYQLVLPDGSRVWLNSASKIKYPTIFQGKNRIVELSGEAYFDIKENKKSPFVVKTDKANITVLGTKFNINSYEDEPEFSTTLISGSVKVSTENSSKIVVPGQQAQLLNSQPKLLTIKKDVDISQVVAWQKGMFEFKEVTLEVIARQISRWYDVDVIVEIDNKKINFSGGISKKTPLKTVLKVLSGNGIRYKWEDNTITLNSN